MTIKTKTTIHCDGPTQNGCPTHAQYQPTTTTNGAARDQARNDANWTWNHTKGDQCPTCQQHTNDHLQN